MWDVLFSIISRYICGTDFKVQAGLIFLEEAVQSL